MHRIILQAMGVALALLAGHAIAQVPAVPPRDATAFVRVNVLPMDGKRALHDQTVIVEDGVIVAVDRAAEIPQGARIVDGQGKAWLLPGLADMHNHLHGRHDLAVQLALGITTTLHMGEARNTFVGRMRAAVEAGELAGPRAFVALAVDGSPRYGHLVVSTPEQARATVQVARANGYDFIKAYNNLPAEVFEALAAAGCAHGMPVVGHGVSAVGLRRQLEAGQVLVAHAEEFFYAFFPEPAGDDPNAAPDPGLIADVIALLHKHDVAVVADLVTYQTIARRWGQPEGVAGFLRSPEACYLPPEYRVSWPLQSYAKRKGSLAARVEFLREFVARMDAAGFRLLSGTDAQDIPGLVGGFALHQNLAALVDAGLDHHSALATATRHPGEFLRRHKPDLPPVGIVAPGARADLLLVEADPLEDLSTLKAPQGVMADGRWYSRNDLAARLDAVRKAYADVTAQAHCVRQETTG